MTGGQKFALVKSEIYRSHDDAEAAATGHSYEEGGEYYLEKAETHSVGRALMLLGYEAKRIASRPASKQEASRQHSAAAPEPIKEGLLGSIRSMWDNCIKLHGDTDEILRNELNNRWGVTAPDKLTQTQGTEAGRWFSNRLQAHENMKKGAKR